MNKFKYTGLVFATILAFTTLTGCANDDVEKDTDNKTSQVTDESGATLQHVTEEEIGDNPESAPESSIK